MPLNQDRLRELTDALAVTTSKMKPLADTAESLKAQIRELLASEGPGDYTAGDRIVHASANRRLSPVAVAEKYPAAKHPQLYKLVVDTKAVRRELDPEEVESFMEIQGDLKIGVE